MKKILSFFNSREQTLASFHKKCEGKVMQIAVESDCKSPWEKEKRSRDAFTIRTRFKRLPADGRTRRWKGPSQCERFRVLLLIVALIMREI